MAKSPCLSSTPGGDLRKDPRGRQKPVKWKLPKSIRGFDHPRSKAEPVDLAKEKKGPGAKTELLFLAQMLRALKVAGRAVVIVPYGVLFGSSKAHCAVRKELERLVMTPEGAESADRYAQISESG
jgi:hypothetical protein